MNISEHSLTSFSIPSNQIIYGTIDYQKKISGLSIFENDPKKYLPSIISHIFNSALSTGIQNPFRISNINIIDGLQVKINDNCITISPGILIFDGITIFIFDEINLLFNKQDFKSNYTHIILSIEYIFGLSKPIKFNLWWFDINSEEFICITSPGYKWNSQQYIFKLFYLEFHPEYGLIVKLSPDKYIKINNFDYSTTIPVNKNKYLKYLQNKDILELLYPFYKFIGMHNYYGT